MLLITMKQAEKHGNEIFEYVMYTKDPVVITERGEPSVAMIPPEHKAMRATKTKFSITWEREGIPGLNLIMTTCPKVIGRLIKGK